MSPARTRTGLVLPAVLTVLFLVAALSSAASWARAYQPDPSLPANAFALRVYYRQLSDIERLQSYDLWEFNNLAERYVLVGADQQVYQSLRRAGWRVAVDEEATARLRPQRTRSSQVDGDYRTVDQLHADLAQANESYPLLTEVVDYGDSYCKQQGGCVTVGGDIQPGYDLLAIRVTNEALDGSSSITESGVTPGAKPVFILMANIHAREITTPEIAMRLLDQLLADYDEDADINWLVDWHEIWIIPTVNPDGHWLVELGNKAKYGGAPFYQRKNANNDANTDEAPDCLQWPPTTFAQYGIDLNRNHSFGWGPIGSSSQPCNLTYRGPSAASEPEVAEIEALISSLIPDQRGDSLSDPAPKDTTGLLITLHSYSNLVLWPWGNTIQPAPNRADLKAIGDRLAEFNGYHSCQPSECLYETSGSSDDWAYGELGIAAFTFEVGDEFMPPYEVIDATQWPNNGPALLYAASIARSPYATIHGPEIREISLSPIGPVNTINVILSDSLNGGQPVSSGRFSIDLPDWDEKAELYPLRAGDGTFDTITESAEAWFDTSELALGRHLLFVRGQDVEGNWGPVGAVFFEVTGEPAAQRSYLPALARP